MVENTKFDPDKIYEWVIGNTDIIKTSLNQIKKFYDVNPNTDPDIQSEEPLTPGYGSTVYYSNIVFYIYP
jgi:hypothetical protein